MPRKNAPGPGQSVLMAPTRRVTLSDVLERVLDKGLILDADLIILLAGVPLIGVKLRAAIAGMETMHKYGLMTDWDQQIRGEHEPEQSTEHTSEGRRVRRAVPIVARS